MAIKFHPARGTILICDFNTGFCPPEMVKRRPVIVISNPIRSRANLCTVVALSTTPPKKRMPYHAELILRERLPHPYGRKTMWIKGDMINVVAFHRLTLMFSGRDSEGKRQYITAPVSPDNLALMESRVLHGLGLSRLTKHIK